MTPMRFGVIGCGAITTIHQLPALQASDRAEVVALVDRDAAWLEKVAGQFGVRETFTDHRALVGRVDAVLVATPNATHAAIASEMLENGIHVLCEKPAATTREDMQHMLAAARHGGARLMAAHCTRFSPNIGLLHRVLSDGWLGALTTISAGVGGDYSISEHRTDFRRQRALAGGGVLVDLGIHLLDLAVWLAGAAPMGVRYSAEVAPGWELETDAEVALEFPRGGRATLACSFTHALDQTLTVRGTDGWARLHLYSSTEMTLFAPRTRVSRLAGMQDLLVPEESRYRRQIDHFCDAIVSGEHFLVTDEQVLACIDVIEHCYRHEEPGNGH
jgi:predicted dehydrogenase